MSEICVNFRVISTSLGKINPDLNNTLEDASRTITMFLPTDDAFAKLPVDKQRLLNDNNTKLSQVLLTIFWKYFIACFVTWVRIPGCTFKGISSTASILLPFLKCRNYSLISKEKRSAF